MNGIDLYQLSYAIAKISTFTHHEAYIELRRALQLLAGSDGACDAAFYSAMRNIGIAEFSEAIKERLG